MNISLKKILAPFVLFIFCLCAIFLDATKGLCADESENRSVQLEDKIASVKQSAIAETKTTSELIELLKQRALLKIKKKKKERLLRLEIFASASSGYETNVNNDSSNKGDIFNTQFAMISWKPTFTKWFGLNANALSFNQLYSDFTDSNYLFSSVSTAARLYPFREGRIRLEPGIGYETLWYPLSSDSSYNNLKYFLNTKTFFSPEWNSDLNFEYSVKEYDAKKARNPSGVKQEFVRQDERYALEAGLSRNIGRYIITLEGKASRNSSNDLLQDLNDYYAFESSLTIAGLFLEDNRLYIAFTPNFERKNYKERQAIFMAEYDDRYNYRLSMYYTLTKNYTLSYRFDYWSLDSNNPLSEYKNIINQIGISARF